MSPDSIVGNAPEFRHSGGPGFDARSGHHFLIYYIIGIITGIAIGIGLSVEPPEPIAPIYKQAERMLYGLAEDHRPPDIECDFGITFWAPASSKPREYEVCMSLMDMEPIKGGGCTFNPFIGPIPPGERL